MKNSLKSLSFKRQTISKLNSRTLYGGTETHFTIDGCPVSFVHCPSRIPDQCPNKTEYHDCHLSEVRECYTNFLCPTDY